MNNEENIENIQSSKINTTEEEYIKSQGNIGENLDLENKDGEGMHQLYINILSII